MLVILVSPDGIDLKVAKAANWSSNHVSEAVKSPLISYISQPKHLTKTTIIMSGNYKPSGYNCVSPYLVVDGAQRMIDLLKSIFGVRELRKYNTPDGKIVHSEVQLDDSVIMIADSTNEWPQNQSLIHVYVGDVDAVYKKALATGCHNVHEPREHDGDPDRRGSFRDFAGNVWSVSTQIKSA